MIEIDSLQFKCDKLIKKGIALYFEGEFEKAIKIFNKALVLIPNAYSALVNKGSALMILKRYPEMIDCFKKSIQIKEKPMIFLSIAIGYFELNNNIKAVDYSTKGLNIINDSNCDQLTKSRLYSLRGKSLHKLKRTKESLESLDMSIFYSPFTYEFIHTKCLVLRDLKRFDEALAFIEDTLNIKEFKNDIDVYNIKINILLRMEEYEKADDAINEAQKIEPAFLKDLKLNLFKTRQ